MDKAKVEAVTKWPKQTKAIELRSFLGCVTTIIDLLKGTQEELPP